MWEAIEITSVVISFKFALNCAAVVCALKCVCCSAMYVKACVSYNYRLLKSVWLAGTQWLLQMARG